MPGKGRARADAPTSAVLTPTMRMNASRAAKALRIAADQLDGGTRETAELGHPNEILQLPQIHAESVVAAGSYTRLF